LIGYGNEFTIQVTKILRTLQRDLEASIKDASTTWSKKSIDRMLKEVTKKIEAVSKEMQKAVQTELAVFADGEMQFAVDSIKKGLFDLVAVRTVSAHKISAAALAKPFNGRLMSEWFAGWSAGTLSAVKQQVTIGFVNGEAPKQVAARILGNASTKALIGRSAHSSGARSVLMTAQRNAQTIARTAISHYSSVAHDEVWKQNEDILDGVMWRSTLDTRTSEICMALDGTVYPIDEGERPPAHPNCRSTMVPVTKSWKDLGLKGKEIPASTRASMDGQVPANMTYSDWLRDQSRTQVENILGPERAGMFLDDGVPLGSFVTDSGYKLTLDELHRKGL
jgi:SPP1 gp7 family putative phage head morphogenesis protein